MKPLVKWVGGKRKLLPVLLPLVNGAIARGCTRLIEPFAGGAALTFETRERWNEVVLSDLNADLINFYRMVQGSPATLAAKIDALQAEYNSMAPGLQKVAYIQLRDHRLIPERDGTRFAQSADKLTDAAAQFAFLNRAGYNGLWRENRLGGQNVPWGKKTSLDLLSRQIADGYRLLQGVVLESRSYADCNPVKGDLVYVDSPYLNGFAAYTKEGFSEADHADLVKWCLRAQQAGAEVIISNGACMATRRIYGQLDWTQQEVRMARAINSKGSGRGKVTELIFHTLL